MGAVYQGQCLQSGTAAIVGWCSANYPKVGVDAATGRTFDEACAPASDSSVVITRTVAADPASGSGGSWTWTNHDADPGCGSGCYSLANAWTGSASDACASALSWMASWGASATQCTVQDASAIAFEGSTSQVWHFTAQCSGCAGPQPVVTTQTIPLTFAPCDAAEVYADVTAVWGIGLVACALVWAAKTFVYRLVANQ
jgi:hypothetical protein